MSASSKKKLRCAENAEKMTEKQRTERQEAKKLKVFTIVMVAIVVAMVIFAISVAVYNRVIVPRQAEKEAEAVRNTIAVTIGDHEISNAELNYFYIDTVNNFYSNYGSYASAFGLDLTKPLNEQYIDEDTTWADDFLQSAIDNATSVYALVDEANAAGHSLSTDELLTIDSNMSYLSMYASYYGYSDVESYLKAMYGNGATEEGIRAYLELSALANSYYNSYSDSLTYTDDDLRAAEAKDYTAYSSFSYNTYYLSVSSFYEGGTTDEEGNTTYSEEEIAAAQNAALAAAEELAANTYSSTAQLDAAIAALGVNSDSTSASSYPYENVTASSISSMYADWIIDEARAANDVTYVENTTTSTDDEGNEVTTVNGYYVVYFVSSTDNIFPLADVRHILVAYEGGTTDDNGNTTYSDEEKAAALATAEDLLAQWESGEATEESFAELANEKSADGDGTTGGLYEDVYPGQMVTNFNDWCFDENRKAGDTGIVESEYGYHIMYYVGDSDLTYRDYLITQELTSADVEEWYSALLDAQVVNTLDTQYINTALVLSAA